MIVLLQTLPETIGLADKLNDVSAMGEPVQESQGELLTAKDLGPIGKVQIGGDNDRHPLIQG